MNRRQGTIFIIVMIVVVVVVCVTVNLACVSCVSEVNQANKLQPEEDAVMLNLPNWRAWAPEDVVAVLGTPDAVNNDKGLVYMYTDPLKYGSQLLDCAGVFFIFDTLAGQQYLDSIMIAFEMAEQGAPLVIPVDTDIPALFGINTMVAPVDDTGELNGVRYPATGWFNPVEGISSFIVAWERKNADSWQIIFVSVQY